VRSTGVYLTWTLFFENIIKTFFFAKNNQINQTAGSFYRKLKKKQLDGVFIYDTYYHFKNLYYLRRMRFFTVGLTNQRVNP